MAKKVKRRGRPPGSVNKKKSKVSAAVPVKKTAKKAVKKKAGRPPKAAAVARKKQVVASTLPNPVAGSFIVVTKNIIGETHVESSPPATFYLADNAGDFSEDASKALLFKSEEIAQSIIDGAMIFADTESMFSLAQVVPAKSELAPSYSFELVPGGEYMLSVRAVPKDSYEAMSFQKAKAEILANLKAAVRDSQAELKAFEKSWG